MALIFRVRRIEIMLLRSAALDCYASERVDTTIALIVASTATTRSSGGPYWND
jgi:hypothetical protein